MKKSLITSILLLLVSAGSLVKGQQRSDEYLGLPGDNLNLYAVMNLFQNSQTLEEFERRLNDPDSRINNLDLNGDNIVDYIMVTDHVNRDVHTIVLQVALTPGEKQDVAVFTVQRFYNGSVQIQLIGDETLYGENYIIEPIYDDNGETPNPGYNRRGDNVTVYRTTTFEIASWPTIRFLFSPGYVVWHSSWYWGYYPSYWHPWTPFSWHYYYGYQHGWDREYYGHYRHWNHPRYEGYHDYYYRNIRSGSPQVSHRIREGYYKPSYSHPEQRRDGEALYNRMNSDRRSGINSRPGNHETANDRRRPDNQSSYRNPGNTGRQGSNASDRSVTNSQPVSRRETARTPGNQGARLNTDNQRSTRATQGATVNRRENRPAQAATSRRSETSGSVRNSSPNKGAGISRGSRESRKEAAPKKEGKTKKSDSSESSRRK